MHTVQKQQGTATADAVCCGNKPTDSDWTNSTGCDFTCNNGYYDGTTCKPYTTCTQYKQQGTATADAVCCSNKLPTNSDWTNSTGCDYTCEPKGILKKPGRKHATSCNEYYDIPDNSEYTQGVCAWRCKPGYQYSQTEHKCIVDIPSYVMAPLQTVPQELKDRLNGITFDTTRNGRKVRDINDVPMCKLQRVIEDFQHAKCEKKKELIQQFGLDETVDIPGPNGRYKTGTSKEELKQCLQNVDSGLHKYARERETL